MLVLYDEKYWNWRYHNADWLLWTYQVDSKYPIKVAPNGLPYNEVLVEWKEAKALDIDFCIEWQGREWSISSIADGKVYFCTYDKMVADSFKLEAEPLPSLLDWQVWSKEIFLDDCTAFRIRYKQFRAAYMEGENPHDYLTYDKEFSKEEFLVEYHKAKAFRRVAHPQDRN